MTKILTILSGNLKELEENSSEDLGKLETFGMKLRFDLTSFGNLNDLAIYGQLKSAKYLIEKLKDDLEKHLAILQAKESKKNRT
jgi:hypothetical protein